MLTGSAKLTFCANDSNSPGMLSMAEGEERKVTRNAGYLDGFLIVWNCKTEVRVNCLLTSRFHSAIIMVEAKE